MPQKDYQLMDVMETEAELDKSKEMINQTPDGTDAHQSDQ